MTHGLLNDEGVLDSTVTVVEHWKRMDDANNRAVRAARWIAMANFYATHGLLNDEGVSDSTIILVEHLKRMDDTPAATAADYDVAQLARQP